MATLEIKGYVILQQYEWEDKPTYSIWPSDVSSTSPEYVCIGERMFDVEIPDDFDPRPVQVANLRAAQVKVRAEAEAAVTNIEEQIQRLLCIEAPKAEDEVIL